MRVLQNVTTGLLFWVVQANDDVYFAWIANKSVHVCNYNISEAVLMEVMNFFQDNFLSLTFQPS